MIEEGECDAGDGDGGCYEGEVVECDTRGGVGWVEGVGGGVLPGVDEEAVEAAERGEEECGREQGEAKLRLAGYGGDEGCGGEEDADGNLLGHAVGELLLGLGAACNVDEDEVAEDQPAEDEIEMDRTGLEAGKEESKTARGYEDAGEEGGAVSVVEAVADFKGVVVDGLGVEEASVHEAVGGVEHPDSDGHGEGGGHW